jgi:hypothetical protein
VAGDRSDSLFDRLGSLVNGSDRNLVLELGFLDQGQLFGQFENFSGHVI